MAELLGAIDRLAKAEGAFVGTEFLAPVLRGAGIGVRIAGVHCRLKVHPSDFEGWGVFKAESFEEARLVRRPSMGERRRYLELFPAARMILTSLNDGQWWAVAANSGDARFSITGLAPIRFVDEGDAFDTVLTRFDGGQFWFESVDPRADPGAAAYLRESLTAMVKPQDIARPGLTAEQRTAYEVNYTARLEQILQDERARAETRLRTALEHAGARLRDYGKQGEVYRVSYEVDGTRHTSVVRKDDLAVVTAGICLSGQDSSFDLASLVGVLREGREDGRIVRTL
ncbi:MAG TPA: hypothetical protein VH475_17925 [Tepidisphaeraceae bacterium]